MGYVRGLSEDEATAPVVAADPIVRIEAATTEILRRQQRDADARRLTTIMAVIGAAFAAVRLGIVTIPHIRRRRAAALGELGAPKPNPARHRR